MHEIELEFGLLVFAEGIKLENSEGKPSEQGQQRTTN